ncbi:MAG: L28 family ribosomal protein [Patescibacteria group bacterium]|jgi:ribosomal protein L28
MIFGCYHCGKGLLYGRSHTHHRGVAGGRWKKRAPKTQRIFKANLVRLSIIEKGKTMRVRLCTKCLKRIRKDMADGKKPFLTLANVKKEMNAKNKETKAAEEAKVAVKVKAKSKTKKILIKKNKKS